MPLMLAMALSGIEREQWESLKEYFDIGAKFFNEVPPPFLNSSPSASAEHSGSTTPTTATGESGIATLSSCDDTESIASSSNDEQVCVPLLQVFHLDTEIGEQDKVPESNEQKDKESSKELEPTTALEDIPLSPEIDLCPYPIKTEFNWHNRNVLDLSANLFQKDTFVNFSQVKTGVNYFFQNRSQISRLQGAYPPPYRTYKCQECTFAESIFD